MKGTIVIYAGGCQPSSQQRINKNALSNVLSETVMVYGINSRGPYVSYVTNLEYGSKKKFF